MQPRTILGKIAGDIGVALRERARSGAAAGTSGAVLASGAGWQAADVICTAGPHDRSFEEQHTYAAVAVVVGGTFQYRTTRGLHMMTPGSLFLGNPGESFECGHEHAPGDRCVAFRFTPEFIDGLAEEIGASRSTFAASRLAPIRESSALVAAVATALAGSGPLSWAEAAIDVAALALKTPCTGARAPAPSASVLERVTYAVREIEQDPGAEHELHALAARARLSTFQFLRAFRRLTGITPHQHVLRARLRESAASLRTTDRRVADAALRSGFNDLSNFNHAFRAEFGVSPRDYRTYRRATIPDPRSRRSTSSRSTSRGNPANNVGP